MDFQQHNGRIVGVMDAIVVEVEVERNQLMSLKFSADCDWFMHTRLHQKTPSSNK